MWLIGGITIFIITFTWALLAGPLTSIIDFFLGFGSTVTNKFMLAESLKTVMALVLVIGDGGTLAWMILSSFKKERVEIPI